MPDIMPNGKKKKCEFCEKIFDSDCHLNEHMTSVHEGKKNFVCSDCKKSFSNPYLLKSHFERTRRKAGLRPAFCSLLMLPPIVASYCCLLMDRRGPSGSFRVRPGLVQGVDRV